MFGGLLQPWHLIIILVIILIVFGPGKLPSLGGAIGKGIREFRNSTKELRADMQEPIDEVKQTIGEAKVSVRTMARGLDEQPSLSGPVICSSCSASNPARNKFCGQCGGAL